MLFLMRRYLGAAALLGIVGVAAAGGPTETNSPTSPAAVLEDTSQETLPTCAKRQNIYIGPDEVLTGNRYVVSGGFDLDGQLTGDLFLFSSYLSVNRQSVLEGDLLAWASGITIDGIVRGDVRVSGQKMTIRGIIEGDVLFFGQFLVIEDGAEIHGELRSFSQDVRLNGHVRGPVFAKGGSLKLNGRYDNNLDLEFDSIIVVPTAHVAGDLAYKARKLDVDEADFASVVDGKLTLQQKKEKTRDTEGSDKRISAWDVFWFFAQFLGAFLVGSIVLRLLGDKRNRLLETIGKEPLIALLLGIAGTLMAPIASVILIFLVITLPLGMMSLAVCLMLVYLAKLPVAFWVGDRIAKRFGADWGPALRLLIGLVPMYLLFLVPYYIGWSLWVGVTFLGFGAMALPLMRYASGSSSQTGRPREA